MTLGGSGMTRRTLRVGFTLLETLVVISIIALLISILLPALNSVRGNVKTLQCASNMRTLTQEFELFVDGRNEAGRGDSQKLGPTRFYISDFQDQAYRIDEFWDLGAQAVGNLTADRELMLCPAGAPRLTKAKGFPCGKQAIGPVADVSLGLNMRLYRAAVTFNGKPFLAPAVATRVRSNILHHPYVPLALDVDGAEAARRGQEPFYVAPPLEGVDDHYATGRYWTSAERHQKRVNVAFVGGHVLRSEHPEREHWDWSYQAEVSR